MSQSIIRKITTATPLIAGNDEYGLGATRQVLYVVPENHTFINFKKKVSYYAGWFPYRLSVTGTSGNEKDVVDGTYLRTSAYTYYNNTYYPAYTTSGVLPDVNNQNEYTLMYEGSKWVFRWKMNPSGHYNISSVPGDNPCFESVSTGTNVLPDTTYQVVQRINGKTDNSYAPVVTIGYFDDSNDLGFVEFSECSNGQRKHFSYVGINDLLENEELVKEEYVGGEVIGIITNYLSTNFYASIEGILFDEKGLPLPGGEYVVDVLSIADYEEDNSRYTITENGL